MRLKDDKGTPIQLLLLDDEPMVGKRLRPALIKLGCDVEVFQDSVAALARIREKCFDIVVTDIRMDTIDGMQVLKQALAKNPETKVILITGYAMTALAKEAMEGGAFEFIAKPFKPDDLRAVILKAAQSLGKPIDPTSPAVELYPPRNQ